MRHISVGLALTIILLGISANSSAQMSWTLVDSMVNAFSMAGWVPTPVSYDAPTNALAIIHRGHSGYGSGGQLFYNFSTNGGTTWPRVPGGLNAGWPNSSRYPSCVLFNPTGSSNPWDLIFVFGALQLTPGAFGFFIYGFDQFAFVIEGDSTYWSINLWTSGPCVMLVARRRSGYELWRLFCSTGGPSIPPTWTTSNSGSAIGGAYRNGISYFGNFGIWPGEPGHVYNLGYSQSSDSGRTWSNWIGPQPDWRSVPGIAGTIYDDWWNYGGPGLYSFEMLVDANNRVHFFGVVEDTTTRARAVVEIYETGTGWAGKIITPDLKPNTRLTYGDLNQMGNQLNAAINSDGTVMALAWLDGPSMADTLPDIWFSNRHIASANWSTPQNITQTPNFAELMLHSAPVLRSNGNNSYTMFLVRNYETRLTTYPPSSTVTTSIFSGIYTFNTVVSVGGSDQKPGKFSLEQNYPNPFNPLTIVNYSVPPMFVSNGNGIMG